MNCIVVSLALMLFQNSGSISGYVVKMGTGEPLSKSVVTITGSNSGRSESYSASTTSNGQFSFQNLNPGQYRLFATRSGYIRMEYGARAPNRSGLPITLNPSQALKDVVLQLTPAGTISGRVFDRDGEPLANVSIEALKYSYQEGQRVLNVAQTARTDDLGGYRLFWLQPGQYFVSATPPAGQRGGLLNPSSVAGPGIGGAVSGFGAARRGGSRGGGQRGTGSRGNEAPPPAAETADDEPTEGYVPVYYPGTIDSQSAAPIIVSSGVDFSGVDLTVETVRTVRINGQVINGVTGQPAQNATVTLLPASQTRGGRGFRGARNFGNFRSRVSRGSFEIRGVPPGSYEIAASFNERNNRMTARLPLEVGSADVHNVALVLTPGFTLTGRLVVEGEQTGASNQNPPRMRVMLRPDSSGPIAGAAPASVVQADGSFTLQQVGRDDYRVSVAGMPRNAYIKSARYGAADVMNEGLRLDGQPAASLDIVVSTNAGAVDGVVSDQKQGPAVNVTVVFAPNAPLRARFDLYRTTSTDANGHFHIDGIAPGGYKVFAWENVETGAWQDPDFIGRFEDRGAPVRIDELSTTQVDSRLISEQQ